MKYNKNISFVPVQINTTLKPDSLGEDNFRGFVPVQINTTLKRDKVRWK